MITLCEKCYPYDGNIEIYSKRPIGPCDECGRFYGDDGIKSNLYPTDPRVVMAQDFEKRGVISNI